MRQWRTLLVAALFAPSAALAQAPATETAISDPPALAAAPAVTPPAPSIHIPAGTSVQVELTEPLSSETSHQEQLFGLRLAEPIVVDGHEVVPVGAAGGGEVIDAARSSFGGRQGRLIVAGRFLEIGGQHARIRGMQLTSVGQDRSNTALAAGMLVGIPAFFIQGGEVHVPAGARATALLAADIDLPLTADQASAAAQAPAATQDFNQGGTPQ